MGRQAKAGVRRRAQVVVGHRRRYCGAMCDLHQVLSDRESLLLAWSTIQARNTHDFGSPYDPCNFTSTDVAGHGHLTNSRRLIEAADDQ